MGNSRIVNSDFWKDDVVSDKYSTEERYFFLYLLTNPNSKQSGIYHLPIKIMAFELGYSTDIVEQLLEKFVNEYKNIIYNKETQEIAILNYLKYSVMKGGKPVNDCIRKDLSLVKDKTLIAKVYNHISKYMDEHIETTRKYKFVGVKSVFLDFISKIDDDVANITASTYEGSKVNIGSNSMNIHSTYEGSKVDIGSNSMNIHSTYVGTNNNNYNNKNNYNNNTTITNVIVNENDNEIDNDINNDNDIIVPRIVPRIDECVNDDKKVVVKEEKNITTTVSKVGVNEDLKLLFNKFWTSYPKKVGKPKCEDWFKKNKVDEGLLNLMLESIENWKQTQQWQKDNGQYIPNPLTWLNRNGWEDEVPNIKTNNANGLDYSQVDPKFLEMMFE